jgi:hypothetical protein
MKTLPVLHKVCAFVSSLAAVAAAHAASISFTYTGTASGTIGNQTFDAAAFTLFATGDTANLQSAGADVLFLNQDTASISIDGLGTFLITTATRTFINNSAHVLGFSGSGIYGADLYDGSSPSLGTWDLVSNLDLSSVDYAIMQWNSGWVQTDAGTLFLADGRSAGSFKAVVGESSVPDSSSSLLFLTGAILGLALIRRRR